MCSPTWSRSESLPPTRFVDGTCNKLGKARALNSKRNNQSTSQIFVKWKIHRVTDGCTLPTACRLMLLSDLCGSCCGAPAGLSFQSWRSAQVDMLNHRNKPVSECVQVLVVLSCTDTPVTKSWTVLLFFLATLPSVLLKPLSVGGFVLQLTAFKAGPTAGACSGQDLPLGPDQRSARYHLGRSSPPSGRQALKRRRKEWWWSSDGSGQRRQPDLSAQ